MNLNNRGQTLIEVIIASSIIILVLTTVLGLITQSLTASSSSKITTRANFLAQEAVETIRNIRDTNWNKSNTPWDKNFYDPGQPDGSYYSINAFDTTNGWSLVYKSSIESSGGVVLPAVDGIVFTRYIKVEKDGGNDNKRRVTVKVKWQDKWGQQNAQDSILLTNWKQ